MYRYRADSGGEMQRSEDRWGMSGMETKAEVGEMEMLDKKKTMEGSIHRTWCRCRCLRWSRSNTVGVHQVLPALNGECYR